MTSGSPSHNDNQADAASEPSDESVPVGGKWWLWPNLLSLDAPLVAMAWLWLMAETHQIRLAEPTLTFAVLGLSVWSIYVVDRLLDGMRVADENLLSPRHRFYRKFPAIFWALVGLAICFVIWAVLFRLPAALMKKGLVVAFIAGFYVVQCVVGRQTRKGMYTWFPKEIFCGLIFAAGVCLPVISWLIDEPPLEDMGILACLFTLNCFAIAIYERKYDEANDPLAVTRVWPTIKSVYPFLVLAVAGGAAWLSFSRMGENAETYILPMAVVIGAGLLWLLHVFSRIIPTDALRVLADVAVIIPPVTIYFYLSK